MQPLSFWWRSWRYLCLCRLTPPPRLVGSCGHSNFFQETKKCRNTKKSRPKRMRFLTKKVLQKRARKKLEKRTLMKKRQKKTKKNPEVLPVCLRLENKKEKAAKPPQPRTLPCSREHTLPRRSRSLMAI